MLKRLMISLSFLTLLSNVAFADVVYLDQNGKAPFAGYLFPEAKAKEVRDGLIERDGFKLMNESLQKSLELQKDNNKDVDMKLKLVTDQNKDLAQNLSAERNTSGWVKLGYFALGCLATGLLYNVAKATK